MPTWGGKGSDDEASELSSEDIEWRIGARPKPDGGTDVEGDSTPVTGAPERGATSAAPVPISPATRGVVRPRRLERSPHVRPLASLADRALLWRDAAALAAIILAIGVGLQLGVLGGPSSTEPLRTQAALGATATPLPLPSRSVAPALTIGPVVGASLRAVLDASPTPIPIITLAPTHSPSPTPRKTPSPTARPSVAPSVVTTTTTTTTFDTTTTMTTTDTTTTTTTTVDTTTTTTTVDTTTTTTTVPSPT